ncbi:unnamed protein product [Cylicocyclus nassatus]|uniref:Uncharacterized protein n=1 Tax=Cylicocyclus nassatus TaxID=53992 RepID=A0AA36MAH3_CYLNA|nr:unnamed protein product [Cylicocyclus nassatus]
MMYDLEDGSPFCILYSTGFPATRCSCYTALKNLAAHREPCTKYQYKAANKSQNPRTSLLTSTFFCNGFPTIVVECRFASQPHRE